MSETPRETRRHQTMLGLARLLLCSVAVVSLSDASPVSGQTNSLSDEQTPGVTSTVPVKNSSSRSEGDDRAAPSSDPDELRDREAAPSDPGDNEVAERDDSVAARSVEEPESDPRDGAASSMRVRGALAPVRLREASEPAAEPVPHPGGYDRSEKPTTPRNKDRNEKPRVPTQLSSDIRVWPLKPGEFTFTQAFGCVAQIGGFYRADPDCPGQAPVVHTGIDLAAPLGTRFYAAASGWVTEAGLDRPEGVANTRIVIQHDGANRGYATEYLHWIASYVDVGDYVEAGDPIGEIGSVGYSTGPHLHFSVIKFADGSYLDPLPWLPEDRRSEVYAGLSPGTRPIRFKNLSIDLPDYADPSPPPVPEEEPVPQRDRDATDDDDQRENDDRSDGTRDADKQARNGTSKRADRSIRDEATRNDESGGESGSADVGSDEPERTKQRDRDPRGSDAEIGDLGAPERAEPSGEPPTPHTNRPAENEGRSDRDHSKDNRETGPGERDHETEPSEATKREREPESNSDRSGDQNRKSADNGQEPGGGDPDNKRDRQNPEADEAGGKQERTNDGPSAKNQDRENRSLQEQVDRVPTEEPAGEEPKPDEPPADRAGGEEINPERSGEDPADGVKATP